VGLLLATARAVITSLKEHANELAATALLEETLRVINVYAEPHWRGHSISELPDMIHELARDRDDFKKMSIAYREDLATAEKRVKDLETLLRVEAKRHEDWCNVYSSCSCSELDELDEEEL
jgi:hypothetical protein